MPLLVELGNANANTYLVTSYLMEENALGINDVNVVCVLFTLHCLCRGVVAREYREGHSDQKSIIKYFGSGDACRTNNQKDPLLPTHFC